MIIVGSCYFLLTLLSPYRQNIDIYFLLRIRWAIWEVVKKCLHVESARDSHDATTQGRGLFADDNL